MIISRGAIGCHLQDLLVGTSVTSTAATSYPMHWKDSFIQTEAGQYINTWPNQVKALPSFVGEKKSEYEYNACYTFFMADGTVPRTPVSYPLHGEAEGT